MNLNDLATLLKLDPTKAESPAELEKAIRTRLWFIGVRDTCNRCGGSGSYSWNRVHGTMCYGCNGKGEVGASIKKKETVTRAQAAVDAGAVERYLAERKARSEAKAQIKPLLAEIEALGAAIHVEGRRAYGEYGNPNEFAKSLGHMKATSLSVRSLAHKLVCEANDLVYRTENGVSAHDVDFAVKSGAIDPEQGLLFALAILTDCRDRAKALLATAKTATDEQLRAAVHPVRKCPACGQDVQPYGDAVPGQLSTCYGTQVNKDGSERSCFARYTV